MKILFSFFVIFWIFSVNALTPENRLPNESQEKRAMKLFLEVKCLICAGQSIESSNTEFSLEMRKLIRGKISQGKSDEQIKLELTKEFGENILMSFSLAKKQYILLWILPLLFSVVGLFFIFTRRLHL